VNKTILDRGLQDILHAERELRAIAEGEVSALRRELVKLAYKLAGAELEEIRRNDPNAPGSWSAGRWDQFFTEQLKSTPGWTKPEVLANRLANLQEERQGFVKEIDELRGQLSVVMEELECLQALGGDGIAIATDDKAPPATRLKWPEIPTKPPARFAPKLSRGDRWKREALVLNLMATRGWSLRLEVLEALGAMVNVAPRSGSLKRLIDKGLATNGLVDGQVITMYLSQPSKLAVLRLTDEGRELCRLLGWEPVESDWEKLIRYHNGEEQEAHTAAVLSFVFHARKRGWSAETVPDTGNVKAQPDAAVEKDNERVYVEVELGQDKPTKWRNLAEMQGFVAICAANYEKRERLVGECKLDKIQGRATDIESLIRASEPPGPLWIDHW